MGRAIGWSLVGMTGVAIILPFSSIGQLVMAAPVIFWSEGYKRFKEWRRESMGTKEEERVQEESH